MVRMFSTGNQSIAVYTIQANGATDQQLYAAGSTMKSKYRNLIQNIDHFKMNLKYTYTCL